MLRCYFVAVSLVSNQVRDIGLGIRRAVMGLGFPSRNSLYCLVDDAPDGELGVLCGATKHVLNCFLYAPNSRSRSSHISSYHRCPKAKTLEIGHSLFRRHYKYLSACIGSFGS
jgi:hypothetical protein